MNTNNTLVLVILLWRRRKAPQPSSRRHHPNTKPSSLYCRRCCMYATLLIVVVGNRKVCAYGCHWRICRFTFPKEKLTAGAKKNYVRYAWLLSYGRLGGEVRGLFFSLYLCRYTNVHKKSEELCAYCCWYSFVCRYGCVAKRLFLLLCCLREFVPSHILIPKCLWAILNGTYTWWCARASSTQWLHIWLLA